MAGAVTKAEAKEFKKIILKDKPRGRGQRVVSDNDCQMKLRKTYENKNQGGDRKYHLLIKKN